MNKRNFLFLSSVFLFCFQLIAQQTEKEQKPLIEILKVLQDRFDVNFSYADKNIENIKVVVPNPTLNLSESLTVLQQDSSLTFTLLDNNFIAISRKRSLLSFCGVLKDRFTNQPIVGATVEGGDMSTITGNGGDFKLTVSFKNERITIQSLGYKTISILGKDFQEDPCRTLFMTPYVEELAEVIVVNYLTQGITKRSSGVFEINYDDFGILPGLIEADVLQTVQALPGIQSVDERVSNINIRGGTHDQNLILWDGIKMYQSGHFFGLISAFNPQLTKKVSLVKNGTPTHYTDGVSGTILMESDRYVSKDFRGGFGINLINFDGFVDIPFNEKSSMQLSARRSINDILETPTYRQYFDKAFTDTEVISSMNRTLDSNDSFSFYDVNFRWLYDLSEKDQLRINFINVDNSLAFQENAVVNSVNESRESSAFQRNLAAGIFYNRNWNDQLTTSLLLYGTDYNLKSTNFDILNDQRLIQENNVLESGAKLIFNYQINDGLALTNGYHFNETGINNVTDVNNPIIRRAIKEVIVSHALFSEADYTSNNNETYLGGGLRLNYLEKFDKFLIEPRFRFNQRFLNNFSVEILGELKHQTTTQVINFQNDFLGVENRRWILSNDLDIPIVESKQLSLGLQFNKSGWLLSAEGYIKQVDGITTQSQGFQNQYQFTKTRGSYEVTGIDFLINKKFDKVSTWLGYTLAHNDYTFESLSEVTFPNNVDIRHTVTFASAFTLKDFKLSAGLNWHTERPTTNLVPGNEVLNGELNYANANSSRLKDYIRIDLSATYDFKISDKIQAHSGISLWNVFNEENTINNYYRLTDTTPEEVLQTSLGLTPNATFRMSF